MTWVRFSKLYYNPRDVTTTAHGLQRSNWARLPAEFQLTLDLDPGELD